MSSKAPKAAKAATAAAPAAGGGEIGTGVAAADHGAALHWGVERAVSAAAMALLVWLGVSLLRLPSLDHAMVASWLKSPLAAAPMLLLVVILFWHVQMGLLQVIEDYVHDAGNRMICLMLLNLTTILVGTLTLFAVLRLALIPVAPAGPGG